MRNYYVGIDTSKKTIDASIVNSKNQDLFHDSFLNKSFGFKKLLAWSRLKSKGKEVYFCIENTGHYGRDLCKFLEKNKQIFSIINAAEIKLSSGIKREKSDKKDSELIALYGLKFPERLQTETMLNDQLLGLQLLLGQRKLLQNKELDFQRNIKMMKHCLSNDKVAKSIVRKNTSLKKFLHKNREDVELKIDQYIESNPLLKTNYDLLTSITGIGQIIALNTIVQTHNFTMITDPRKFSCYCGVAPFKNESGTSIRKGTRISFYGHKGLKKILNFGAMNAVKIDPQLKEYYQRKVEEGKNKMSVLNAVRNKLIHRMFAVVNRGTPYVVQRTF
jgi:transposase